MRKLVLLVSMVSVLFAFKGSDSTISYSSNYTDAAKQAKADSKLMFVMVCDSTCHNCNRYQSEVLTDPEVVNFINENFIPVYINPNKGLNGYRVSNWGVTKVPSTVFMTADRKMKRISTGYQSKEELMKLAATALKLKRYYKDDMQAGY